MCCGQKRKQNRAHTADTARKETVKQELSWRHDVMGVRQTWGLSACGRIELNKLQVSI